MYGLCALSTMEYFLKMCLRIRFRGGEHDVRDSVCMCAFLTGEGCLRLVMWCKLRPHERTFISVAS